MDAPEKKDVQSQLWSSAFSKKYVHTIVTQMVTTARIQKTSLHYIFPFHVRDVDEKTPRSKNKVKNIKNKTYSIKPYT